MRLDDIILKGVIREVYVHSLNIQNPGYIYITKSKMGEIIGIKFVLAVTMGLVTENKPFLHSEGGTSVAPVILNNCTFTTTSGSVGSLSYNILEVVSGSILIVGCTFSDLKINPPSSNDGGVIVVKDASITLKNSQFINIELDSSAAVLGSANTECEWGSYSLIILQNAITVLKDTVISNTFAGVSVQGGIASIEGTNFTSVGSERNMKYPSVERHMRCGM
jgi:hypothetical protein